MGKMVYQFKEGSRLAGNAQKVGETLAKIEQRNGLLTPRLALDHARKPTSPLHAYAEWDDAKAADQYRLTQMGHVIRCVVVQRDEQTEPIRAYHFVTVERAEQPDTSGFANVDRAAADDRMRDQIVKRLKWEATQWARQAEQFEVFAEAVQAIRKVA